MKVMKEEGSHEGCIEQLYRLFTEGLYTATPRLDGQNRFRMDEKSWLSMCRPRLPSCGLW